MRSRITRTVMTGTGILTCALCLGLTSQAKNTGQQATGKSDQSQRERAAEPFYQAALRAADSGAEQNKVLDEIEAALKAGASASRALSDPAFAALHTAERFRDLMRDHTTASEVTLIVPGEKGIPLRVSGVVRDPDGKPVPGALVGAYHTDSTGIYSELGNEHPRIFGYMRTDANGQYAFNSIRPAAYPNTQNIEQHIHYVVTAPGFAELITESGFADDPIWKGRRVPAWAVQVTKDDRGVDCCQFDMVLKKRAS